MVIFIEENGNSESAIYSLVTVENGSDSDTETVYVAGIM